MILPDRGSASFLNSGPRQTSDDDLPAASLCVDTLLYPTAGMLGVAVTGLGIHGRWPMPRAACSIHHDILADHRPRRTGPIVTAGYRTWITVIGVGIGIGAAFIAASTTTSAATCRRCSPPFQAPEYFVHTFISGCSECHRLPRRWCFPVWRCWCRCFSPRYLQIAPFQQAMNAVVKPDWCFRSRR